LFNLVDRGLVLCRSRRTLYSVEGKAEGSGVSYTEFYLGIERPTAQETKGMHKAEKEARSKLAESAEPVIGSDFFNAELAAPPNKEKLISESADHLLLLEASGQTRIAELAMLYSFPATIPEGFLYEYFPLVDEVVFKWEALDQASAVTLVDRVKNRLTELASERVVSIRIHQKLAKVERLAQGVGSSAKLLRFWCWFLYSAPDPAGLRERRKAIRGVARRRLFDIDVPRFFQRALYEYRTSGESSLGFASLKPRYVDTASASVFYPLISEELVDPGGVFLGTSATGSPVLFDPWAAPNPHVVILGETGAGKSLAVKLLLKRLKARHGADLRLFGIDPANEYVNVLGKITSSANAVKVSPGAELGLDPFRLARANPGSFRPEDVSSLLSEFYLPRDESFEALSNAMRKRVFDFGAKAKSVEKFCALLRAEGEKDGTSRTLFSYLEGTLAPPDSLVFSGDTPKLEGDVVFGLKGLEETRVGSGNRLKALVMTLLSVYLERELFSDYGKGIFFVDEAWLFVDYPATMGVLESLARQARKYNKSLVFVTQRPWDVAKSGAGRTILEMAATSLLFRQRPAALSVLEEVYRLREEEARALLGAEEGDALMRSGNHLLSVHVQPSEDELAEFGTTGRWLAAEDQEEEQR
jgi:hypothetical protein